MNKSWEITAERLRNWGRWGPEDELGTLNHITPERLAAAAALCRRGRSFSLAIPLDAEGPQGAHGMRRNPIHLMSLDGGDADIGDRLAGWGGQTAEEIAGLQAMGPFRFNDDWLMTPLQASTQWDALAHAYYGSELYNGFAASEVTSLGALRNGIDVMARAGGVCGRGVLLDVARYRGVESLGPGEAISTDELTAVARSQSVEIGPGDIVVVRTGWITQLEARRASSEWIHLSPGVNWQVAEWLSENQVAAIAADNVSVEVQAPTDGVILPFHMIALRDMGMPLGEIWDLEALAADCADDGVYEFFLSAPPLRVPGATGSPINPIAFK